MTPHGAELYVASALRPGITPAGWDGALRIDDALAPGLVAEVAVALGGLPWGLEIADDARSDVRWRCTLTLPPKLDPQLPGAGWRLVRLLARDLPPLASAIVGRAVTVATPHTLPLVSLRKGSYVDDAPSPWLEAIIGLTAHTWPASWGGHTELPALGKVWPPGRGTIDLVDAGVRRRVPLVTRHVESLALHVALVPA
jgi:hypothetical protein